MDLGTAIAGGVIGALLSPSPYIEEKHIHNHIVHRNERIEYHEWLEKKIADEKLKDSAAINKAYVDKQTHCPKCGAKITRSINRIHDPSSFIDRLHLKACCNCQSETSDIDDNSEFIKDFDETIRKELAKLYCKITGVISYDEIKGDYMKKKLADAKYDEKFYGTVKSRSVG